MKRILFTAAVIWVATASGAHPAGAAAPRAAISTLKADFVMTRRVSVLKQDLTSRGHLALGGEGRLRFETEHPSRSVLVINGGKGWLHYPELGVTKTFDATSDPVMKLMSEQLAALTKGDFDALKKVYDIEDTTPGIKTLVPIDPNIKKLFKALEVSLQAEGVVTEVALISQNGDTTRIQFRNAVFNAPLPPALFDAPGDTKGPP